MALFRLWSDAKQHFNTTSWHPPSVTVSRRRSWLVRLAKQREVGFLRGATEAYFHGHHIAGLKTSLYLASVSRCIECLLKQFSYPSGQAIHGQLGSLLKYELLEHDHDHNSASEDPAGAATENSIDLSAIMNVSTSLLSQSLTVILILIRQRTPIRTIAIQ